MKRSTHLSTTATLLLAIAAAPGLAADADIPAQGPMPFDGMDTNHDGYVSQEEYRQAHRERLEQRSEARDRTRYSNRDEAPKYADIDTDHDGRVSREEFQVHRQQHMQQQAQEREQRRQEHMERRQELMQRHEERMMEPPAGDMGGGKR